MNSTTPGTLISYRFSPGSCCISSCPTISLPVTTCPFNVNLSPFSRAFHSYRVFCLLPPLPNSRLSKKQFPFFTWLIVILQPFIVCQRGRAQRGAEVKQMFEFPPATAPSLGWRAQIYHRKFLSFTRNRASLSSVAQKAEQSFFAPGGRTNSAV